MEYKIKKLTNLIDLTRIFQDGYTIEVINDKFFQYARWAKPFIVSFRTFVKLTNDNIVMLDSNVPSNCIVGYWFDKEIGIGWIEENRTFKFLSDAISFAKRHGQKCIYDFRDGETINV